MLASLYTPGLCACLPRHPLGKGNRIRAISSPALKGEFRVAERKITMQELLQALEEGRVREIFGSGTACQVCPVHQILYEGKVRRGC